MAAETDLFSNILSGGGGVGGGALVTYLLLRSRNGESSGLAGKVDQMINLQNQTNMLLAEIKGALHRE